MASPFTLAVCAEMVFTDLPIAERVRRIDELGFQVEIWDWTRHDLDALAAHRGDVLLDDRLRQRRPHRPRGRRRAAGDCRAVGRRSPQRLGCRG